MGKKYIAFMDLLGTKAMAIANPFQYRSTIETFHNAITDFCKEYTNMKVYVFSDCAYLECESFCDICFFFKDIRERLLEDEICFNAAICEGKLKTNRESGENANYVIVDFKSEEVVEVFSLQSCFTGAGIYIDPRILNSKKIKQESKKILVESVYANVSKEDNRFIFKKCIDIKFQRSVEQFLQFILNLYVKTYILDKRAARYYYTIYATYINEQEYERFLDNKMKFIDIIINSVQTLCDYDGKIVVVMLLINRLYNSIIEGGFDDDFSLINDKLYEVLSYIYDNFHMERVYNIRNISSNIISDTNKLLFADFLIKKSKEN